MSITKSINLYIVIVHIIIVIYCTTSCLFSIASGTECSLSFFFFFFLFDTLSVTVDRTLLEVSCSPSDKSCSSSSLVLKVSEFLIFDKL